MALSTAATATIAISTATSAAVRTGGLVPVGLIMPSAWDAARLELQVSVDNSTFVPVYLDDGSAIAYWTVGASRAISLTRSTVTIRPWPYIKLRSVNTGSTADVNQTAQRLIQIALANR